MKSIFHLHFCVTPENREFLNFLKPSRLLQQRTTRERPERTHQQLHDENASIRIRTTDEVRSHKVSNQGVQNDGRERRELNTTNAPTKELAQNGTRRTKRREKEGLVQTGGIRLSPVYTIDTERETEEDVHECDTKQWIEDKGGGKNRRNAQK